MNERISSLENENKSLNENIAIVEKENNVLVRKNCEILEIVECNKENFCALSVREDKLSENFKEIKIRFI